ncbi:hypothetical protein TNCV_1827191 [Trichonephila clavipes]|nr:hypothetical protein TNCV_1827191 [Trichonephila clavipes]
MLMLCPLENCKVQFVPKQSLDLFPIRQTTLQNTTCKHFSTLSSKLPKKNFLKSDLSSFINAQTNEIHKEMAFKIITESFQPSEALINEPLSQCSTNSLDALNLDFFPVRDQRLIFPISPRVAEQCDVNIQSSSSPITADIDTAPEELELELMTSNQILVHFLHEDEQE